VGFGLSPVQRDVSDVCSGPAGLGLELSGPQPPMEPHARGKGTMDGGIDVGLWMDECGRVDGGW